MDNQKAQLPKVSNWFKIMKNYKVIESLHTNLIAIYDNRV